MNFRLLGLIAVLVPASLCAQSSTQTIDGWKMQDSAKVSAEAAIISKAAFEPQDWYAATVPGTVLTTLVNNGVYPEPLYGENMRDSREPEQNQLLVSSDFYRSGGVQRPAYLDSFRRHQLQRRDLGKRARGGDHARRL